MQASATSDAGSPITRRNPSALLDSSHLGWSQVSVVEPGRFAILSGQTATPRDRSPVPSRLADQASMVAEYLAAALTDLQASPCDVVSLRMLVVGATTDRFMEAWAPIRDMLKGERPSMTGIGVAALWTPALQLEVDMIVRVP